MKFTGGASYRRQPALPESGGPGHRAGRAGIRGRGRGLHAASRTPRDQDAPSSEVVSPECGMAVDLRGSPGTVSGVQFTAAKGSVSSAYWSKPPASKLYGVETQPGNVLFKFWSGMGKSPSPSSFSWH